MIEGPGGPEGGSVDQDKAGELPTVSIQDGNRISILGVGTNVCVRNRFLGDWITGFKVAEVLGDGYRIRRLLDDCVFPDVFAFEDVQRERRQHPLRGITGSYLDRHH